MKISNFNKIDNCALNTVLKAVFNNRYMKMLPVIAILTLFTWGIEVNAQCASGFTQKTIPMTINGCNYDVFFCVRCIALSYPGEVYLTGFVQSLPVCVQTLTSQQVFDAIVNQMNIGSFIWQICPESIGLVQPCPNHDEHTTFIHWTPVCWQMERRMYLGIHDRIYYTACDTNAYCYEEYYICYQELPPPGQYLKFITAGPTIRGTITCTLEPWEVETPTEFLKPTQCYIYDTPCNE